MGIVIGVVFVGLAFFPKVAALLIAIPGPVAAAYVTVLIALLFVQGMKIIVQDGVDHRKAAIVWTVVLDRRGVPEPVDLRGPVGRRIPGRVARQRHDFGRSRRLSS